MSLITLAFGDIALITTIEDIITMINANPHISPDERKLYLRDWSVATGIPAFATDYYKLVDA